MIHGPMYQFECDVCRYMDDPYDTEEEANLASKEHDCLKEAVKYGMRDLVEAKWKKKRK